jgi:hypothetical protein
MPSWLLWIIKGFTLGLVVSGVNFYLLLRGIKRIEANPTKKTKATLVGYYSLRYLIDLGTLFIAYFFIAKNASFLIGVAFGLTIPNTYYLFKFSRVQVNKRKE